MGCGCQDQNAKTDDYCADAESTAAGPIAEVTEKQSVQRRTLLKAAAVGTTVAAFAARDGFTPYTALADDLSTFQCTANDVRIIGAGQIINEPCDCNGTFNAVVNFTVENNAASDRGCITLHLVPNSVFAGGDILLQGTIAGKTTQVMQGTINNYPCGAGRQCFGSASGDGRNRCSAGECSTVSWTVPGQDTCPPARQISSKCRHQQICIQGRGAASMACSGSNSCEVPCGTNATLTLSTTGGPAPYTYKVFDSANNLIDSFGPTNDLSHEFSVGPITGNASFYGTVTDSGSPSCTDASNSVDVTTTAITVDVTVAGDENCDGLLTYSAAAAGFSGCDAPVWKIDGNAASATETDTEIVRLNNDGTLTYRNLDGTCHTISCDLTCGGCTGTGSATVTQCVGSTVAC